MKTVIIEPVVGGLVEARGVGEPATETSHWTVSLVVEAETLFDVLNSLLELGLPVFAPIKVDRV